MPCTRCVTSPIASANGLPCSAVSSPASSLAFSWTRSAAAPRSAARFSTSVFDHSGKARFAASTALFTSSADPAGTVSTTSSVAGFRTSSSAAAARCSPPISICGTGFLQVVDVAPAQLLVLGGGVLGPALRGAGQLLLLACGNARGEHAGRDLGALGQHRARGQHRALPE